jgi:truncated hemoglobin YjbI
LITVLRLPQKSAGAQVGVSATMIRQLVDEFYAKVRQEEILGPVFDAHVCISTRCARFGHRLF